MSARVVAGAVAWAGAALWAYGMAVLQPLCEPGSVYWEVAENNSYWARDIRWSAILAVTAALWAVTRSGTAVAVGMVWLCADLALDRMDPGGATRTAVTVSAGLILTAVVALFGRPPGRRRGLTWVALACVFAASFVARLESPSDTEPQLGPSRLAAFALLTAAAAFCLTVARYHWWATAGVVALLAPALVPGVPLWLPFALLVPAATGIVLWRRPGAGRGALIATVVALPITVVVLFVLLLQAARPFTALAGNEPIAGADSDPSLVLNAVLLALLWFAAVRWFSTHQQFRRAHGGEPAQQ
ncbi:hypothetical protein Aab01nite_15690 [Paractinoplanes abujensis]|uniref:Uncharacterized protein n=1 Tax=Paractinoplanes abujensis TaxID=882441 RepID=A0A7W7FZK1_9ACTN|nr:hypothetical protein [Actinoplanes abujensis]MBB4690607.1 hypothetical protein [Actinoplanes abujensis]GID17979.1 hypothetical protein Aab01nite_15690 [Actinoplanes abujensis]